MSEPTGMSQQTGALPDETLSNRLEELNRQIVSSMETAVQEFHRDLSGLADHAGTVGRQKAASSLLEAIARIDGEDSQSSILIALLEEGRRFASRTALFLLQPTQVVVWASRGFGEGENTLAGRTIENGEPWVELAEGGGSLTLDAQGCEAICRQLDTPESEEAILIPFVIRGQLGGALYADRIGDDGLLLIEALQIVTHNASQAVELVAFRNRGASPALRRGRDSEVSTLPVWQPVAAPAPDEAETESAPELREAEAPEAEAPATKVPSLLAENEPASAFAEPEPLAALPDSQPAPEEPLPSESVIAEEESQAIAEPIDEEPEPLAAVSYAEPEAPTEPEVVAAAEPTFAEPEPPVFAEPEPTLAEPEPPVFAEPEPTLAEPEVAATPEPPVFVEPEPEPPVFAEPELTPEPSPAAVPSDSFLSSSPEVEAPDDPTSADLTSEAIPEPELEDTSTDIWSLEEDDDEDEEPTMVGQAIDLTAVQEPAVQEPVVREPEPEAPPEVPPLADPLAATPIDSVGQETVRLDIAALQGQAATYTAEPAPPVEPPSVAPVETSFSQPETAYVPPPVLGTEDPTVASASPSFTDPVSSGGFVPPPPEPKPETPSGSNEVRPPDGHHGPGLAFSSAANSDDEALHEEARRLARLLVSEIKLYNEEIIEEGKRHGDIYERLKDDIDRSRQMYQERIDPKLQGKDDYFYQELVQRLAGGDATLLGMV